MKKFNKILIANRGEIALRIIRAAHEMGIQTVAVYSQADKDSLHIRMADEAYCIGEESLADSYLNVDIIMQVALKTNADAIHPGYGFLAENPHLVASCKEKGIVFIGPSTKAISLMGNKIEARAFVEELGIPMTKAVTGSTKELLAYAHNIDLPILVKAAAGGGGKGMKIVRQWNELESVIESTSREALSYFGNAEVFVEKYVENPRHIEIQLLGDHFGNIIHLYERECSIQRRYQKIIEESPSPTLNQKIRERMGQAAVEIAKAINYTSAGTIEFLVDDQLHFYFLEMNTRIQVEHPVTEMVTGVDIVQEQIRIAQGEPLQYHQKEIQQNGHAIEARVYAEDPENDFRPAPGFIHFYREPKGVNIRVDSAIDQATEIKSFFDPMISKLIVWGPNREQAIQLCRNSLKEYVLLGISTNIPFMLALMKEEDYQKNRITTHYCDTQKTQILQSAKNNKDQLEQHIPAAAYIAQKLDSPKQPNSIWQSISHWRAQMSFEFKLNEKTQGYHVSPIGKKSFYLIEGGQKHLVEVIENEAHYVHLKFDDTESKIYLSQDPNDEFDLNWNGQVFHIEDYGILKQTDFFESNHDASSHGTLKSPMPGKVIKLMVEQGQKVKKGETLLIVEAMKMENNILSPRDGKIESVFTQAGEMVDGNKILVKLEEIDTMGE